MFCVGIFKNFHKGSFRERFDRFQSGVFIQLQIPPNRTKIFQICRSYSKKILNDFPTRIFRSTQFYCGYYYWFYRWLIYTKALFQPSKSARLYWIEKHVKTNTCVENVFCVHVDKCAKSFPFLLQYKVLTQLYYLSFFIFVFFFQHPKWLLNLWSLHFFFVFP